MPSPVNEDVFRNAQTIDQLLESGHEYVDRNVAWAERHRNEVPPVRYLRRAAIHILKGLRRIIGLPPMSDTIKVDKDTIGKIFDEVQRIGLQVTGVNQNVNSANSNTAAVAATSAARSATGAVAGGASTLLFVLSGVLLLWLFFRKK